MGLVLACMSMLIVMVSGFTEDQRAGDVATMRAIGATPGFLRRDSLSQAVSILIVSIAVGLGFWLAATASAAADGSDSAASRGLYR